MGVGRSEDRRDQQTDPTRDQRDKVENAESVADEPVRKWPRGIKEEGQAATGGQSGAKRPEAMAFGVPADHPKQSSRSDEGGGIGQALHGNTEHGSDREPCHRSGQSGCPWIQQRGQRDDRECELQSMVIDPARPELVD